MKKITTFVFIFQNGWARLRKSDFYADIQRGERIQALGSQLLKPNRSTEAAWLLNLKVREGRQASSNQGGWRTANQRGRLSKVCLPCARLVPRTSHSITPLILVSCQVGAPLTSALQMRMLRFRRMKSFTHGSWL